MENWAANLGHCCSKAQLQNILICGLHTTTKFQSHMGYKMALSNHGFSVQDRDPQNYGTGFYHKLTLYIKHITQVASVPPNKSPFYLNRAS